MLAVNLVFISRKHPLDEQSKLFRLLRHWFVLPAGSVSRVLWGCCRLDALGRNLIFGSFCAGQEEPDLALFDGGDALSLQNVMEFGRQLAEHVGARLQTGW